MRIILLLATLIAVPGGTAASAAADSTRDPGLLEKLKREDTDLFRDDIWDFDLDWEDSLKSVLDSVGLDEYTDRVGDSLPWFKFSPGLNTHTLAYNRVVGFVPGLSAGLSFGRVHALDVHAEAGYATASKKVYYDGGLGYSVGPVVLRALYGDRVSPFGNNQVHGNSIRALVGGSDDQDYLRETGGAFRAAVGGGKWSAAAGYAALRNRSEPARTDFGLFGKMHGENPEVDEGTDRRIFFSGRLGSYSRDQVRLELEHSISGGALGGDFTYAHTSADLRLRRYVVSSHEVGLRIRGSSATSGAPLQQKSDMGGIDLVRGYARRSRVGDQSLAVRAEYYVPYDLFRRVGMPVLQDAGLQFVPWADAGRAWGGTDDTWITSAGLGLQVFLAPIRYASYLRLDVAFPMGPARAGDACVFLHFMERNF